jgi:hypothetical protein
MAILHTPADGVFTSRAVAPSPRRGSILDPLIRGDREICSTGILPVSSTEHLARSKTEDKTEARMTYQARTPSYKSLTQAAGRNR